MESTLTLKSAAATRDNSLRWTRYSLAAVFFVNGIAMGAWSSAIAGIATKLKLDPESYGIVLGPYAIGAIVSMLITGWLTTKFGSRRVILVGGGLVAVTLLIPGNVPTMILLAGAIFILGAANSVMDISMNAHATLVERDWGAEIMSTFHSSYSFGALAGAAMCGVLFSHGLSPANCLFVAMVLILVIVMSCYPTIGDLRPEPVREAKNVSPWTNGKLLSIALLASLAIFAEFGLFEWSYKYVRDVAHASAAMATLGNGGFALGMALSRLFGDAVIRRIGPVAMVAAGGLLSCAGVLIAIVFPTPIMAMTGFIMAGLGLANVVPMLYTRAAALVPTAPGKGVSVCAIVGYVGALVEPLAIGIVAGRFNQTVGLFLPLTALFLIVISARIFGRIKLPSHH
ncbi:MFS transporter [Glaciimonas sp. PCH181]|uniref:MFS transporter n=1 Tax=Glaciimonas sp. PCH181 TaxID=2133943 RepID=UPI000D3DB0CE|nr:MFS transporter [Glaciimonas sp. PCH181]PUA18439.1 hypothetical protein C7W93_00245 [Glaciimonas sp. PCH181]